MTAIDELNSLLSNLPNYALITPEMKDRALTGAQIPDVNSVWPGEALYIPTYDPYWAALSLLGFLQAQPVVRQSSSEGTSVAVDAPNWRALGEYYKSMSTVAQASGNGILQKVLIPEGYHVHRTDMSGRWGHNDDVDTDLG